MPDPKPQASGWGPPPTPKAKQPQVSADPYTAQPSAWAEPDNKSTYLEPDYHDVYHAYVKNPTPETAAPLLTALHPVINEALRSYAGGESTTGTARARAKVMALDAVRRYDPNRAKLRTHILSFTRGLRRVVERSTAPVYVPEQWRLDARKVDMTYPDMRDELGREPSDAELADRVGISLDRLKRARQVPGVLAGSQAEGSGVELDAPDQKAWNLWLQGIYHDSDPIDQVILEHSFGMHGKPILPAKDIAAKLNRSGGAISLRKARLDKELELYKVFMQGRSGR